MNDTDAADVASTNPIATRAALTNGSSAETNLGVKSVGIATLTNATAANGRAAIQPAAALAVIRIAEAREATQKIGTVQARTVTAMDMGSATAAAIARKVNPAVDPKTMAVATISDGAAGPRVAEGNGNVTETVNAMTAGSGTA